MNLFLISLLILNLTSSAQTLIAGWDFQTTTNGGTASAGSPNSPTLFVANVGTGNLYLNGANGSSSWTTSELSGFSGSALNVASGMSNSTSTPSSLALVYQSTNGKSMVIKFSMSGYSNLLVSYATRYSSATAFTSQIWDYSTDGITWTNVTTITGLTTNFALFALPTITGLNNAANAYIRLTVLGATAANGNNRIDNIQLNASVASSPPVVTNASANPTVGSQFSYYMIGSNSPTSYNASNLPAGLSVNTVTGEISGTPTTAGNFASSISATNSSGTGNGTVTFTINQGSQNINFPTIGPKFVGDAPFNLAATGGASGNAISYNSSNTSVAIVSGSLVTIIGVGSTVITASQAGNANYLAANQVTQTLNVDLTSQVISFNTLPIKYINDPVFTLIASGGASGNPIVFTSSNNSVATISGNIVTIVGAGSTDITASQAGNSTYSAAQDVVQPLQVTLVPQTIVFNSLPSKLITDPPFAISATGGSSGNPILFSSSNTSVATVSGNTISIVGVGATTITASQAGNSIYSNASDVAQSLVVNSTGSIVTYNLGTSTPLATPSSGIPINNLSISAISRGNNANASQPFIDTLAKVTLSGTSGQMNIATTARNKNFDLDSSAYFEFTLTPTSGNSVTLNLINFYSRSTGTGPTTIEVRSSANAYNTSLGTSSVSSNSNWALIIPTISSISSPTAITYRIYGYVTGGTGTVNGSSPNNWRLDDIKLNVSVSASLPCLMTVSTSITPILCNGSSTSIAITSINGNGIVNYKLNSGSFQSSNIFSNSFAGTYTVTASDAFGCIATTAMVVTEPVASFTVSAPDVNGCTGTPLALSGFPSGGIFSVSNPYTGPTTKYTYSVVDLNGCTIVSDSATATITCCAVLNLKLYLQSYYIGSGLMSPALYNQGVSQSNAITDDITVELHEEGTYALVSSSVVALATNGQATASFPSIAGNYFIVIKHRNPIETWSANSVTIGPSTNYDFSNAITKAFNNNLIQVSPGIYALPGADIDQEGSINVNDLSLWESDASSFTSGYTSTDLDGDGNTTLADYTIWETNKNNAVQITRPMFIVFPETVESATKTVYTVGDVTLSTGVWNFDDALIGTSSVDRKTGAKSARLQNTGKLTMNFDAYVDSSIISIDHAKYSTEANSTWALYMSTNGGTSWVQQGATITTSSTTLQTASFTINLTGSVRFQIRKLTGGKLNIDNFNITANTGTVVVSGNDNDHIAFGNPSGAVTDITSPNNYLLIKSQFDLAYDESKGSAAWVAWHLQSTDLGSTPRCDCFSTDTQIPSSFFRASSSNYTGTGFDRGHQVASSQRNNSITNNAVTFLMSNIMPQAPNLNQDTWNDLELYSLSLANSGYELFIYSGGYGSGGTGSNGGVTYTIGAGNINVPSHYWKIIVVLPIGNNDVSRVTTSTRVIAVDMPNTQSLNTNWSTYRTTVDAIETATGLDFLTNLSNTLQTSLEANVDNGPTN